jgi:hypothetical protein
MKVSHLLLLACVGLLACPRPAVAEPLPTTNLAKYVVEHLDVTSFPSSIGPRREAGKTTFKDYGFKPTSVTATEALLSEPDWTFHIKVIGHTRNTVTICLHDKAQKSSYDAQSCLLLKPAPTGDKLIGTATTDPRCPDFAK